MSKYDPPVTTLEDLREALATVQRMGGASPAWKRANRIARSYALQNDISIGQALQAARSQDA
jgi:hypothetical protein